MRIFNYSNYAKTIEIGMESKNITKLAMVLFEPIINNPDLVNQAGNPYNIDSSLEKKWYDQTSDIPKNIKNAAAEMNIDAISNYFSTYVINSLINSLKETKVYNALLELVKESNLDSDTKEELMSIYNDGDNAEFLAKSFLYSLVEDNKLKDDENEKRISE